MKILLYKHRFDAYPASDHRADILSLGWKSHFLSMCFLVDVLRSSGLTRQQEVTKMFTGGLQRVARLTVDEYEAQKKKNEEKQAIRDQKKVRT